jgi:hypothetical protein
MEGVVNGAELKVRKMKFDNNIRRTALRRKF